VERKDAAFDRAEMCPHVGSRRKAACRHQRHWR
jgi:hypothetical protein